MLDFPEKIYRLIQTLIFVVFCCVQDISGHQPLGSGYVAPSRQWCAGEVGTL